jgi:S1-C subfamily serine protease
MMKSVERIGGARALWLMGVMLVWMPMAGRGGQVEDPATAIVKIYTYHDVPDYQNPWSRRGTYATTGSGCIIAGKKILSNAHVVSDCTFVQVRRHGQARRYPARILSVSHAADVALLTVDDPEFFEGVEPLEFGVLPYVQQEVLAYGFPFGGDSLSVTRGVVSRVEHQVYAHSSCRFLAVQIDAAINPGNSGGPALISNRIVGVIMQGISQADNIGYMVPVPIIQHFLEDIEDGHYDGFPSLGVVMQSAENPDLKKRYRLNPRDTGMLVTRIVRGSPAEGVILPGDILMTVEGRAVADDGTVEFRPRERTSVSYYIQEKQVGEPLAVEVWRDVKRTPLTVKLNRSLENDWLVPLEQYDVLPRYFVYGGFVFCPVTINLLKSWGSDWYNQAPKEWVALLNNNYRVDDRDEVVAVLKVLAARVNQGYQDISGWPVNTVNGVRVRNLRHLVELIEAETDSPFVTLENDRGQVIILDRNNVKQTQAEILETYRIPSDRFLGEALSAEKSETL